MTIHYCWFGRGPIPADAQRCIDSWRRLMPGCQIQLWSEDNFDIDICPYVRQAYDLRKFAFVSDYARFWILYHHGGIYLDTDVELIKPLDPLIAKGNFMGFEKSLTTEGRDPDGYVGVNPGLGMYATAGSPVLAEILDYYSTLDYRLDGPTIVYHTTQVLRRHGLQNCNCLQHIADFTIYPTDVLCPMDSTTGITTLTDNTFSIHHYTMSWANHRSAGMLMYKLKKLLIRIFGANLIMRLTGR